MLPLNSLSLIRFTGPDARSFLQGQLSNDLNTLTANQSLLASCNSAQGRVQAIVRLIQREQVIMALLPRSMIDVTVARLRKYILRAKLSIEDASESTQVNWADRSDLLRHGWPIPDLAGEHRQQDGISVLRWTDGQQERFLVLQPGTTGAADPSAENRWQLAEIRAGLPQVMPETHEQFVAQMLNLDVLGGISFNKGCYTGQEIIARAHFRGTVKRRMFRFEASCTAPAPGTKILSNGETAGEVVMAANDGTRCELLAVISLAASEAVLSLESTDTTLKALPLPYNLPANS